jgi:hypothetical protein
MRTVRRHGDRLPECLATISGGKKIDTVPTMFGGTQSQSLAVQLMVMLEYVTTKTLAHTYELIKEFELDTLAILCAAGAYLVCRIPFQIFCEEYLVVMEKLVGVTRLTEQKEDVCEVFAKSLASSGKFEEASIEFLVQHIKDVHRKISVYLVAQMYDRAFVFAGQLDEHDSVQQIYQRTDNERLRKRCEAWLVARQQPLHQEHQEVQHEIEFSTESCDY